MALNWEWKDLMGKITIKQKEKEFVINIYDGNCLAIFLCEYTDEKGDECYMLYDFLSDKKHVDSIVKRNRKIICDEVVDMELNLFFKNANTLLPYLVKEGYTIKCYYKEV